MPLIIKLGGIDGENNGRPGIVIEGSTWMYVVLLGDLVVACYLVFHHLKL